MKAKLAKRCKNRAQSLEDPMNRAKPTWIIALNRRSYYCGRLEELFLETESEWRLFEDLRAMGISFQLNPGPAKLIDPDNPNGRVWFELDECNVRYAGSSVYAIKRQGKTSYFKDYNELVADLSAIEM